MLDPAAANLDTPARIRRGHFPGLRLDQWTGLLAKTWGDGLRPDEFPPEVGGLFYDALLAGHAHPADRPPMTAWADALGRWAAALAPRPQCVRRAMRPTARSVGLMAVAAVAGLAAIPAARPKLGAWPGGTGPALWRTIR